jgi:hypothetical protein
MVREVELHLLEVNAFEVTSSHDTGGQGEGGAVLEKIEEVVLTGEDHGEIRFGVRLELAEGVELGEDLESQEAGLVYDEQRLELFTDEVNDAVADDTEEG